MKETILTYKWCLSLTSRMLLEKTRRSTMKFPPKIDFIWQSMWQCINALQTVLSNCYFQTTNNDAKVVVVKYLFPTNFVKYTYIHSSAHNCWFICWGLPEKTVSHRAGDQNDIRTYLYIYIYILSTCTGNSNKNSYFSAYSSAEFIFHTITPVPLKPNKIIGFMRTNQELLLWYNKQSKKSVCKCLNRYTITLWIISPVHEIP